MRKPPALALSSLWLAGRARSWDEALASAARLGFESFECLLPGPAGEMLPPRGLPRKTGVRAVAAGPLPRAYAGTLPDPVRQLAASLDAPARERAIAALVARAAAALEAGIPLLVVPAADVAVPGRDDLVRRLAQAEAAGDPAGLAKVRAEASAARGKAATGALDAFCRTLHSVVRARPEIALALSGAADMLELPHRDEVGLVLGDVRAARLGYWHDLDAAEALAGRGGPAASTWLGALAPHCLGLALSDRAGSECFLPPGTGLVDWRAVASDAPRGAVRTLRVDPRWDEAALRTAVDTLETRGLA
ncbi:MAG: hypothetical protein L0216_18095 [Planctomycetales bacterium]|nr:hypothetical protein [Planctomycetales bacterium]